MYKYIKRFFDFLFSLLLIVLIAPFLIVIVILLKLTGEGEVFYFQKRIGLGGKVFDIWKFATMLKNSPNIGAGTITVTNDPRVTPVGGFLRKSKLNELPQIINVLLGSMSFVGPRPLVEKNYNYYNKEMKETIEKMKPGITGIGSIVFRDEERLLSAGNNPEEVYRNQISPYKGRLEIWYEKNCSFLTDLKILITTVWVVLFPNSNIVNTFFKHIPKS